MIYHSFPNDDENDLYMLTQEEKNVIEERAYNEIWDFVKELSAKNSTEILKVLTVVICVLY